MNMIVKPEKCSTEIQKTYCEVIFYSLFCKECCFTPTKHCAADYSNSKRMLQRAALGRTRFHIGAAGAPGPNRVIIARARVIKL